jgi:LGFP repeat
MASAIDTKYAQLIQANPWIGKPTIAETTCPDGVGRYRHYQGASIYWSPQTGAQLIYGLIRDKWAALGWEKSPLGYPTTDERTAGSGKGRYNNFQNGTIIWKTGSAQAFAVYGLIHAKWGEQKWDTGYLGFPVTDEMAAPDGVGRYNHFEGGSIYWTPNTGAHIIIGLIRQAWANQGWERSRLGYPVSDELVTEGTNGRGRYSRFEGGEIHWTPEGGTKITLYDVNLEIWFSGFKCLDESSEISGSDEPYMFLGVSTSGQPQTPQETGVIGNVDKGNITRFAKRLYAGIARDVILAVVIREHDEGNPHAFAGAFKSILDMGNAALASQTGGVAVPAEVVKLMANKMSELIGAEDDDVGRRAELLTQDYLIQLARKMESGDPKADFTWTIGSNSEGIYRLYFFVRKV